jgi:hypothetical protein
LFLQSAVVLLSLELTTILQLVVRKVGFEVLGFSDSLAGTFLLGFSDSLAGTFLLGGELGQVAVHFVLQCLSLGQLSHKAREAVAGDSAAPHFRHMAKGAAGAPTANAVFVGLAWDEHVVRNWGLAGAGW